MDKILLSKLRRRLTGYTLSAFIAAVVAVFLLLTGSMNRVAAASLHATGGNASRFASIYPPYAIDPFNMDLSDITEGVAEKHITCYPNPAISYINFKFDKSVPKDARLFVFSFTGKKMEELTITGQILKITLDKYYRGLYVYQLRSASGAILESGKFQVKN